MASWFFASLLVAAPGIDLFLTPNTLRVRDDGTLEGDVGIQAINVASGDYRMTLRLSTSYAIPEVTELPVHSLDIPITVRVP
ncbi:hypothetical protein [Deinococcus apachensis]|uniref:hypothetical protein n=1 Tax=Deinococcus apachensis TaxID=309886 RepID=UPI000370589E|nr:hypothetical protein [Deinococcus apachensis]